MFKIKLPGSKKYDSQIQIHTGTKKNDVSLAKEFQKNLTKITAKMVPLIKENSKMIHGKKMDRQTISCSG